MNSSAIILQELQELSPALAAVSRVNVYSVPNGYFDRIADTMLVMAYESDGEELSYKMAASVPEGYFDSLAANIMSRIKNEVASGEVNEEINSTSPVLDKIGNKNVLSVPAGYFETLPAIILGNIKKSIEESVTEETRRISALVSKVGNVNVYSVPVGYFESLSVNHPVIIEKKEGKVIKMQGRTNVFRYAAAAVVTGIVAVSSFFIMNNSGNNNVNAERAAMMAEAKNILKTNSFDEKLAAVSDEAIVNFLESKGQDVEAALVASLSDDNNLPASTDYLFNDETLEDILKTIDLNN